jgi:hypothetical protein
LVLFATLMMVGGALAQAPSGIRCLSIPVLASQLGDLPPQVPDSLLPCDPVIICSVSNPPTVTSIGETQVLKLNAPLLPGNQVSQFKALEIQAQVYSATLGWQPLFQHGSFDVVERAGGTATSADYFASGLKPGARHRFRVAWCREGNGRIGCECWSVWTEAASAQPSTFPAGPIALPAAPIVQEVGLPFHFTTSDPPADPTTGTTGGDGWGPSAIWTAPFAHFISRPLAGGGSETFGRLIQSTTAKYQPIAQGPISFTEAQFRPLCTSSPDVSPKANPPANTDCTAAAVNYRTDLESRFHAAAPDVCQPTNPNATRPYYYAAQIAYEPNFGEPPADPSIRVFRVGPAIVTTPCVDQYWLIGPSFVKLADLCSNTDFTKLTDGSQILGRIEVTQSSGNKPKVAVVIGWDCTATACTQTCTIDQDLAGEDLIDVDIQPLHPLLSAGRFGTTAHHWDLRFDYVRFGSKP